MKEKLLIKKLSGRLSIFEEIRFQRRLKNDQEFQQEFKRISKIWHKTQPPEIDIPNKNHQWLQLSNKLELQKKSTNHLWKPAFAMAMTILLIVIGIHVKSNFYGYEYYSTLAGEKIEITLPDGSEVSLNAESNIKFAKRFRGNERTIELAGEAYFEVQPDDKEFVVYTENARTRVLGTGFNLWARKHATKLSVNHGRVGFNYINSPKTNDIILTKNQKAECRIDNTLSKINSVDAKSVIIWKQGGMYFSETPLHEILDEVCRQYNIQIALAPNVDSTSTLTATFIDNTPEEILEAIAISSDLKIKKNAGRYILR